MAQICTAICTDFAQQQTRTSKNADELKLKYEQCSAFIWSRGIRSRAGDSPAGTRLCSDAAAGGEKTTLILGHCSGDLCAGGYQLCGFCGDAAGLFFFIGCCCGSCFFNNHQGLSFLLVRIVDNSTSCYLTVFRLEVLLNF